MKTISFYKAKVYQLIKIGAPNVWPWPAKIDSKFAIRKIDQVVNAALNVYKMGKLSLENADYIFGRDGLQGVSNSLKLLNESSKFSKKLLKTSKAQRLRALDEYDITKPYAMGLLVADIFYSLSAAIEGDIY